MKYRFICIAVSILLVMLSILVIPDNAEAIEIIEDTVVLGPEEGVRHRINVTYDASVLNGLSYFFEILDWGAGHEMQFNIEFGEVGDEYLEYGGSHFNQQNGSGEIEVFEGDAYGFNWGNDNLLDGENFTLHYKIEYKYQLEIPGPSDDDDTTTDDDTTSDDDTTTDDDVVVDDDSTDDDDEDTGVSGALITLIAVIIAVVIIIGLIIVFYFNRRKK